jgi:hypothetical protein
MEHLTSDMIGEIAFYLSYIQILALALTCRGIRSLIDKRYLDFSLIIRSRLERVFGKQHADLLHENLSKYQRYICGSFVLQTIYGEEWIDSDIDIYHLGKYYHTVKPDFKTDEFMYTINDKSSVPLYRKDGYDNYSVKFSGKDLYPGLPIYTVCYTIGNTDIDYTTIASFGDEARVFGAPLSKNIFDFHEQFWDIDICMVVYDGKKLYIKNLENLFTKKATARFTEPFIDDHHNPAIHLEKLLKCIRRIKKYKNRGFDIKLEYDVYETSSEEYKKAMNKYRPSYADYEYQIISNAYRECEKLIDIQSHSLL